MRTPELLAELLSPLSKPNKPSDVKPSFLVELLPALLDAEGIRSDSSSQDDDVCGVGEYSGGAEVTCAPLLLLPRALRFATAQAALIPGGGLGSSRRGAPALLKSAPTTSAAPPSAVSAPASSATVPQWWALSSCPAEVAMCLEDLAHLLLLLLGRTSRHARALSRHWAAKPDRRVVEFVQRLRTSGGEGSGGSAVAAAGAAVGTDLAQPLTLPKAAVQALAFNLVQVGDLVRVCPDEQEVQRSHRSYARGIGTNSGMLRDCGAVLPVRDSKVVHRSPVLLVSNSASVKEGNKATSPPTSSASRALAALLPSSSSSSVYMWNPKLLTVMCRKADIPRYRHLFAAKSSSSPSLLLQPHETLSAAETDSAVSCFLAVATSFASASSCGPSPWSFEGNVSDSDLGRLFALFE